MSYIATHIRQDVIERASSLCEYCGVHQDDGFYTHEVDHIIPEKHRGETHLNNLCLACFLCNRHKGSDFASFDPTTDEVTPLFNPRQDRWIDHFRLSDVHIIPISSIGRVTVFILKLNDESRIRERQALADSGRYPLRID